MLHSTHIKHGQTLLEILIAIGVVGIIFTSAAALIWVGILSTKASRDKAFAERLLRDMSSGVRGMASQDWHSFWGSNGLVSYWGFDEGMGTVALDPVNGNNATSSLSLAWQSAGACKVGSCISFDGNSYLDAGNNSTLNFTSSDFTISVWIKANTTTGTIVERGLSQTDGYTLMFDPYVHLLTHQSGTYTYCRSQNPVGVGTWTHWVAVRQGSNIRLYRNGVEDVPYTGGTCTSISNPVSSTRSLTIGKGNTWGSVNGTIDEVRIYNRALSDAEIQAIYNATK